MKYNFYILDWIESPQGDPDCVLEKEILGDLSRIHYIQAHESGELPEGLDQADAIAIWHNFRLHGDFISRLDRCKVIVRNGVGVDSVDLKAASDMGIPVCNVPDYGTEEVADHAMALALALTRRILPLDDQARSNNWNLDPHRPNLRRLRNQVFGIVGLGRIGTAVALRAKAFGFQVAFYDPYNLRGAEKSLGITRADQLEELLAQADVLSLHCPLNESTHHLISERELARLKATSFLINTSRGEVVDQKALNHALLSGKIAGAGLDVLEGEPNLTGEDLNAPNTIITCHAAFCSRESVRDIRTKSSRTIRDALEGKALPTRVNRAASP